MPTMPLQTQLIFPPTTALQSSRNLSPTVEHVEDHEPDYSQSTSSSIYSSATSSTTSLLLSSRDDEIEEIIRPTQPLTRRDFVNEIAMSLWGLVKPKNFDIVMPGVYRSSYPKTENYNFLKTLGIRSILTLVPEPLPTPYKRFIDENGIDHIQVCIEPNKSPFVTISQCNIAAALGVVLNRANHPILIHCNKGKHRTGCVVGCLRKVLGSEMEKIHEEYRKYAGEKARFLDVRFIELFDERAMSWLARINYIGPVSEPIDDSPINNLTSTLSSFTTSTRLRT